jgi:hypothetical protein
MAHYAILDDNNIVTQVISGKEPGEDGVDWEQHYSEFYNAKCKRTEYVEEGIPYRKNYAGLGYTYDEQRDAFLAPQPFPSWILNEITCTWESPIPYPNDGLKYRWDEEQLQWIIQGIQLI